MSQKRFAGLTQRQFDVFGQITIGKDLGHHPKTLEALEKRGLIKRYWETLPGWPPVKVASFSVPIDVHAAWCQWCSEQEADKPK